MTSRCRKGVGEHAGKGATSFNVDLMCTLIVIGVVNSEGGAMTKRPNVLRANLEDVIQALLSAGDVPSCFAGLRRTLEEWLESDVEHVGSTAVAGLSAKPVIDIMAPVKDLPSSTAAITAAEAIGYRHYRNADGQLEPFRTDTIERNALPEWSYVPKQVISGRDVMMPELTHFADTDFTNSHCFHYAGHTRFGADSVIAVEFEPVASLAKGGDLVGTMYRRIGSYRLLGVRTSLSRIPTGLQRYLQKYTTVARFKEAQPEFPCCLNGGWRISSLIRRECCLLRPAGSSTFVGAQRAQTGPTVTGGTELSYAGPGLSPRWGASASRNTASPRTRTRTRAWCAFATSKDGTPHRRHSALDQRPPLPCEQLNAEQSAAARKAHPAGSTDAGVDHLRGASFASARSTRVTLLYSSKSKSKRRASTPANLAVAGTTMTICCAPVVTRCKRLYTGVPLRWSSAASASNAATSTKRDTGIGVRPRCASVIVVRTSGIRGTRSAWGR